MPSSNRERPPGLPSGHFAQHAGLRQPCGEVPANLSADPQAEVWGVLYKITRRDLVRLDATEGIPWSRYRPLWLDAEDIRGNTLSVVTYMAEGKKHDGKPHSPDPYLYRLVRLKKAARSRSAAGAQCHLQQHAEAPRYSRS